MLQKTIGHTISFAGVGLHTGRKARVVLRPADENTGYLFVDKDREVPVEIPATFDLVTDTKLATTIGRAGGRISTIEHLIAAFRGMDVDNVIVEVEGGEIPIMDGSAAPFVYMIRRAGIVDQQRLRKYIVVRREVSFADGEKFIRIAPHHEFAVEFTIDFPHPTIGRQSYSLSAAPERFEREVAQARTFGFFQEVEYLKSKGFALGGTLENAVVVGYEGVINREGLRTEDELVRHKILDLVGDIALLGYPVIGKVEAFKSGHELNNKLCREIFENRSDFAVAEFSGEIVMPGGITDPAVQALRTPAP